MKVEKRNGTLENISFDKILDRIESLSNVSIVDLPKFLKQLKIDAAEITKTICDELYDGVKTSEIDKFIARKVMQMVTIHPDYGELGSRITISDHHKNTLDSFHEKISFLYEKTDLISKELYDVTMKYKDEIEKNIQYDNDFTYDYFAFKTLERSYLLKWNGSLIERPQDLLMRVSLGLHGNDLESAFHSYRLLSNKYFIHASPTLFNAGTTHPQLLSCFLLGIGDSVHGIYKCLADCAQISKWAGGIGIHASNIRGNGSLIKGTNGKTSGLVPMLKVFNDTACFINQGGKRNGSFAIYLEPHHPDILDFLDLKKNHGNEAERARDLFYAVWISDLFMKRVRSDEKWSLFSSNECKDLENIYGNEYEKLYLKYEQEKKYRKQVSARELWTAILQAQIETGTPYICYKDSANIKSNQKNIGTIKSSNLCSEIIEYSDDKEYACCTLASLALTSFVKECRLKSTDNIKIIGKDGCPYCDKTKNLLDNHGIEYTYEKMNNKMDRIEMYEELMEEYDCIVDTVPVIFVNNKYIGGYKELESKYFTRYYDFELLGEVTRTAIRNLNKVIDLNYYPVPETKLSNKNHRPLGLGVQGLADAFIKMRMPFDSEEARDLNKKIFETIYYYAMLESLELSKKEGPYSTFKGSPISQGKFQFNLWEDAHPENQFKLSGMYDWDTLREEVKEHGIRNSLLIALMPTASTSQILGNNECFEPYTSNIYTRSTLAGEFVVMNKWLIQDLIDRKLWCKELKDKIVYHFGSIQAIDEIPDDLKQLYKTVWEIKQKVLIDLSADRGYFVDQSQSLNLFVANPTINMLSKMHMYGWKRGLKTGIYYLRQMSAAHADQFSLDMETIKKINNEKIKKNNQVNELDRIKALNYKNEDVCESCQG